MRETNIELKSLLRGLFTTKNHPLYKDIEAGKAARQAFETSPAAAGMLPKNRASLLTDIDHTIGNDEAKLSRRLRAKQKAKDLIEGTAGIATVGAAVPATAIGLGAMDSALPADMSYKLSQWVSGFMEKCAEYGIDAEAMMLETPELIMPMVAKQAGLLDGIARKALTGAKVTAGVGALGAGGVGLYNTYDALGQRDAQGAANAAAKAKKMEAEYNSRIQNGGRANLDFQPTNYQLSDRLSMLEKAKNNKLPGLPGDNELPGKQPFQVPGALKLGSAKVLPGIDDAFKRMTKKAFQPMPAQQPAGGIDPNPNPNSGVQAPAVQAPVAQAPAVIPGKPPVKPVVKPPAASGQPRIQAPAAQAPGIPGAWAVAPKLPTSPLQPTAKPPMGAGVKPKPLPVMKKNNIIPTAAPVQVAKR